MRFLVFFELLWFAKRMTTVPALAEDTALRTYANKQTCGLGYMGVGEAKTLKL